MRLKKRIGPRENVGLLKKFVLIIELKHRGRFFAIVIGRGLRGCFS
jgi:hypothetical protein